MRAYSLGKGRKRAVRKFTIRHGLWITAMITATMVAILVLWLIDFFRFDAD